MLNWEQRLNQLRGAIRTECDETMSKDRRVVSRQVAESLLSLQRPLVVDLADIVCQAMRRR